MGSLSFEETAIGPSCFFSTRLETRRGQAVNVGFGSIMIEQDLMEAGSDLNVESVVVI